MFNSFKIIIFILVGLISCSENSSDPNIGANGGPGANGGSGGNGVLNPTDWLIPQNQVLDGGPGKDGIPALENPETTSIDNITYLSDNDLVIGYYHNGEIKGYPHSILDWHEIINDDVNGKKIAVTYCPLTGTGIGWNRMLNNTETTFGVSGLLYNTNLIPYDRLSGSNWCQISLDCVNGTFIGQEVESYPMIETSWKTWKEMFPNSQVVSSNTGFNRNYGRYPYGNYKVNNDQLLFPVSTIDERLPAKERVLTIIEDSKARVYRFDSFEGSSKIFTDIFNGKDILIVGDKSKSFIVAFENNLNGDSHTFTISSGSSASTIFADEIGNKYDIFGNVVEGPDVGSTLMPMETSFMAYWFSVGAFYSTATIFGNN